jgi:hypothetical protein
MSELFEPKDWESLLEGWLIHAWKERKKHQECRRKFESWHRLVSLPAVTLSAIAALPVVASLGQGTAVPIELRVVATALIILAAAFVALDRKEFGATAEKHRAAEFNYKDVIRQIEAVFASRQPDGAGVKRIINPDQAVQAIQERLRVVDAQSPVVLAGVDEEFEKSYKPRDVVTDLAKERD